jgi:adenylate cyclase class 2
MSKDYIEKEIKVKVENPKQLLSLLAELKAEKKGEGFQRTTRMDTPDLNLEKQGTFLRVRTGGKDIVTLKKKIKSKGELFERMELETEVKDPELLADIFANLGFTKRFIMEKYRIDYSYKNTKISVDELPFGVYVEIEGEPEDIQSVARELNLNLSKKIVVTYWDLFEEHKKQTGQTGENIVFPQDYHSIISSKPSVK